MLTIIQEWGEVWLWYDKICDELGVWSLWCGQCGYYFTQDRSHELRFCGSGPFADVRRHRCVNNYWWVGGLRLVGEGAALCTCTALRLAGQMG